ncbi:MAG TPA: di-heme oxidoredictase family protein [Anaerolineae bacterium]|nr:di-heme oxidoredictase family protein [Anaerolineae bacterium]
MACQSGAALPGPTPTAAPVVIAAASTEAPFNPALSGGQTTIFNTTPNAFGQPAPGLERMDELFFFVGNSFFNQNWVIAPASTTARDGLGPMFNSRSCAGCHFKDGRGRAPNVDGESPTGFLIRLSIPGASLHHAPVPEPTYGGQFQNEAIMGVPAEGKIKIEYQDVEGQFGDGSTYSLRQPTYTLTDLAYGEMHPEVMLSPRVANQMIGLGLLEAVPEATLLEFADPADRDGDGISGRPNYVWDAYNNQMAIGRFGWKANQPHLLQQVAGAFNGDMGITTDLFATDNCAATQPECQAAPHGGAPEIAADDLLKVVLYASALAVPARRNLDDPVVREGEAIFAAANCTACHSPVLETGVHPTIPALSYQTIQPYTDLLLHDMGDGLADHRPDFQASGSEWRTPPLWGIGLFETVNGHTNYLHDGRARNLMEAILWHGGEAEAAKEHVLGLSGAEREALIAFLKSL